MTAPLAPLYAYREEFEGDGLDPATRELLGELAGLMQHPQGADAPEVADFIARHRANTRFTALADTSRCLLRALKIPTKRTMVIFSPATQPPVDTDTSEAIYELAELIDRCGSTTHPDVTTFVRQHSDLPEFPDLARSMIG